MYIWVAADVSKQLANVRNWAKEKNREIGLDETALSLPQHISLKISFFVPDDRFDEIVDGLTAFFADQRGFEVKIKGVERFRHILWVALRPSENLQRLHRTLDEMLLEKYAVPQHELDKHYLFHSTLFMEDHEEKLLSMQAWMQRQDIPCRLWIDRFLIGCSETGKSGEYRVHRVVDAVPGL